MNEYDLAFLEFIRPMVNENRLELIESVLSRRTRYITPVLEDIYQPHNASAVLRTCDCLGIQDVHIIENRNIYELNPEVELGAAQWLSIYKYNSDENNTGEAINSLKEKGYRIIATSPHANDTSIEDFNVEKGKAAFLFGTEMQGLSGQAMDLADEFVKIPMLGFTESFNISVSAALILSHVNRKLRKSKQDHSIESSEKEDIRYQWIRNSVNNIHTIEKGFKLRYGY
jgi:tRNA (guanosine-2'-O-)-methyltransferase